MTSTASEKLKFLAPIARIVRVDCVVDDDGAMRVDVHYVAQLTDDAKAAGLSQGPSWQERLVVPVDAVDDAIASLLRHGASKDDNARPAAYVDKL